MPSVATSATTTAAAVSALVEREPRAWTAAVRRTTVGATSGSGGGSGLVMTTERTAARIPSSNGSTSVSVIECPPQTCARTREMASYRSLRDAEHYRDRCRLEVLPVREEHDRALAVAQRCDRGDDVAVGFDGCGIPAEPGVATFPASPRGVAAQRSAALVEHGLVHVGTRVARRLRHRRRKDAGHRLRDDVLGVLRADEHGRKTGQLDRICAVEVRERGRLPGLAVSVHSHEIPTPHR